MRKPTILFLHKERTVNKNVDKIRLQFLTADNLVDIIQVIRLCKKVLKSSMLLLKHPKDLRNNPRWGKKVNPQSNNGQNRNPRVCSREKLQALKLSLSQKISRNL